MNELPTLRDIDFESYMGNSPDGYRYAEAVRCPSCGSDYIHFIGMQMPIEYDYCHNHVVFDITCELCPNVNKLAVQQHEGRIFVGFVPSRKQAVNHDYSTVDQGERLIVSGSRGFTNYDLLCDVLNSYLETHNVTVILSGGAVGADKLGLRYAKEKHIKVEEYIPDWHTHGRKAGVLPNIEMAKKADSLIAFWDGQSKGTEHMIDAARKEELNVQVIKTRV